MIRSYFSNINLTLTSLAIFSFPLAFLSIRHGIHVVLFFLLLLSIIDLTINAKSFTLKTQHKDVKLALVSMSAIFFATFITQALQGSINFSAYDGPSKILCAALIFLYLKKQENTYINILEIALPFSGFIVLATLLLNPETSQFWGGRLASKFVDPNSMGSQATILGLLCLTSINIKNEKWLALTLKLAGGTIYFYISTFAGSRGGWLAILPVMTAWLLIQINEPHTDKNEIKHKYLASFSVIIIGLILILALYKYQPFFAHRVESGYSEIANWISGQKKDTSAGIRLTMWEISLHLIQKSPLWGFGTSTPIDLLNTSIFNTLENKQAIHDFSTGGPHSDILAKLLSGGLIGLSAYFLTLLTPGYIFWKNKNHPNPKAQLAARIGIYYMISLFFCGLVNEMLSLKYLSSFYGLMVACLLAETLKSTTLKSS